MSKINEDQIIGTKTKCNGCGIEADASEHRRCPDDWMSHFSSTYNGVILDYCPDCKEKAKVILDGIRQAMSGATRRELEDHIKHNPDYWPAAEKFWAGVSDPLADLMMIMYQKSYFVKLKNERKEK